MEDANGIFPPSVGEEKILECYLLSLKLVVLKSREHDGLYNKVLFFYS